MKTVLFVDAVGLIDTDLLESYTLMDQRLRNHQIAKKRKSKRYLVTLLAAALAMLLCVALLVTSLPLIYVFNAEKINTAVSEGVENILFPLDKETEDGEDINPEELLINWVEWKFAEEFFNALGAGTDDSVIDKMQSMQGGTLAGESMQVLGEFLQKLYEYFIKHYEDDESDTDETTSDLETEPPEAALIPGSVYTDDQRVEYQLSEDCQYYTVMGKPLKKGEHMSYYELIIPADINGVPVTKIADEAFYHDYLTKIEMPEGIIEIGDRALACPYMTTIVLPSTLEVMGEGAFAKAAFEEVVIPSKVTVIPDSAFQSNQELKTVAFLGAVTEIGDGAFSGCDALRTVELPQTVISIGKNAFSTSGLSSLIIPPGVTVIESGTFQHTPLKSITLPEGIVEIGEQAFFCCNGLSSVELPESLQKIGVKAFYGCGRLTELELPAGLSSIDEAAFMGSGIETLMIPEGIQTIPAQAFYGMNAKEIYFSTNIVSIGEDAFGGRYQACKVYFQGTLSEWESISKHKNVFDKVADEFVIVCTDGEIVIH